MESMDLKKMDLNLSEKIDPSVTGFEKESSNYMEHFLYPKEFHQQTGDHQTVLRKLLDKRIEMEHKRINIENDRLKMDNDKIKLVNIFPHIFLSIMNHNL